MNQDANYRQTVLRSPFFGDDGVIRYRLENGRPVILIYSVAQQAMWGRRFAERYMSGLTPNPYAEYVDIDLLPSPVNDEVALAASSWIIKNAYESAGGGSVWLHDFDFVYNDGDLPVTAPWLSGVGQANMLLACLYWRKHTGSNLWDRLARQAVVPFGRQIDTRNGLAFDLGNQRNWFEEYPTLKPAHILNCHLLSLVALDKAISELGARVAQNAWHKGWIALKERISLYDRKVWSRYDLSDLFFLFIRLVSSANGYIALEKIELETQDGIRIASLNAGQKEPCDDSTTRLAGIDWGPVVSLDGKQGRLLPNCQSRYINGVPVGGTDQNTYLIFQEKIPYYLWAEHGLKLKMTVYIDANASLILECRDSRLESLSFLPFNKIHSSTGKGWEDFCLDIMPQLIGQYLPQHYQRFHTELLGILAENHKDDMIFETFQRWHSSALFDILMRPEILTFAPKTVFVFVNDKCGLHCKMCDWGIKDKEAALTRHMTQKGTNLQGDILYNTLESLNKFTKSMEVYLTGTEPLLYPGCFDLLRKLKTLGVKTSLTTNGLLLEEKAVLLSESRLDQITLSIDGPPEVHDDIRGYPGLFNKVLRGVSRLKTHCLKNGLKIPAINISFTISKYNHTRIIDFFTSIHEIEPNSVILSHLNYVTPEIADAHNQLYPSYSIKPSSVKAWQDSLEMDFWGLFWQLEEAREIEWTEVCIIPYCITPTRLQWYYTKPYLPMSRLRCFAPWTSTQVLVDGTLTVLGRCFDVTMGDLKEQNISEIWHGVKYEEFRNIFKNHISPACFRCCGSL